MTLETLAPTALPVLDLPALLGGVVPALVQRRGDLLAVKDLADGRYVHVNDAMAAFLGLSLIHI